jgi:hypothetical protein
MEQLGCYWTDFLKFYIGVLFEILSRKYKIPENLTGITGILHKNVNAIMISR